MNNREIKFRAWDTKRNKMIGDDYPNNWGGEKDEWYWDENAMRITGISEMSKDERFNLMQFTGLRDKNGKEIYEGDILRWGNNSTYEIYEVIWKDDGFKTKCDIGYGRFDIDNLFPVVGFELIGNVYKNPELLSK